MPDTNTQPELPPLPNCEHRAYEANYSADQMREYARTAILADRSRTLQSIDAKTADRDAVTVNLMRLFRLDKREARDVADFIQGRLQVDQADLLKSLRAFADSEYVKGVNASMVNECLGEDPKMTFGTFGKAELEAHRKAARHFGAHFGIYAAIDAQMDAVKEPR